MLLMMPVSCCYTASLRLVTGNRNALERKSFVSLLDLVKFAV